MPFNQQFTVVAPNIFDGAAPTDTPDGDAAGALVQYVFTHSEDDRLTIWIRPGLFFDGTWYSPQHQLPGSDGSDWDGTSPYTPLETPLPGVCPVPYPHWLYSRSTGSPSHANAQLSVPNMHENLDDIPPIQLSASNTYGPEYFSAPGEGNYSDTGKIDVSPSYGNTLPHMNQVQWSASNTYGYPYNDLPAPDQGHHHASSPLTDESLYPDLPPGKGSVSGMSDAVVGKCLRHSTCLRGTDPPQEQTLRQPARYTHIGEEGRSERLREGQSTIVPMTERKNLSVCACF
jgi:hypothetical protein